MVTDSAPWIRLSFLASKEEVEAVQLWLQEECALGAETVEDVPGECRFHAYFPAGQDLHLPAERLQAALGRQLAVQRQAVADGRWEQVYYQGLSPFLLGERFIIHPGDAPREGDGAERMALWIPPGRAFGTGDHATTLLCLEFLERRVRPGQHVLEV
jgi:ribosomal protein L11 methylase PrmA